MNSLSTWNTACSNMDAPRHTKHPPTPQPPAARIVKQAHPPQRFHQPPVPSNEVSTSRAHTPPPTNLSGSSSSSGDGGGDVGVRRGPAGGGRGAGADAALRARDGARAAGDGGGGGRRRRARRRPGGAPPRPPGRVRAAPGPARAPRQAPHAPRPRHLQVGPATSLGDSPHLASESTELLGGFSYGLGIVASCHIGV
jgi:hypothetical protein